MKESGVQIQRPGGAKLEYGPHGTGTEQSVNKREPHGSGFGGFPREKGGAEEGATMSGAGHDFLGKRDGPIVIRGSKDGKRGEGNVAEVSKNGSHGMVHEIRD